MTRGRMFVLLVVCQLAAVLAPLRAMWWIWRKPGQAVEIIFAYDRLGNAVANGRSTETISSRANRARVEGRRWGCVLCRWLDWLDPNHCRDSAGV